MKHHEHYQLSEEKLNAYLDDELDFEDKNRVFERMEQDPQLSQEMQKTRQLQTLLRHAYTSPPPPPSRSKARATTRGALNALAASVLLVVGALFGWFSNDQLSTATTPGLASNGQEIHLATSASAQQNLLLHLSSNDPDKMNAALGYAEQFLTSNRQQASDFRLELVVNDGGIELLRRDTSPFALRIKALQSEFNNVDFLACANALRRLHDQGIKVDLLPGTKSEQNALDQIIHRLEGGWRYLKV